MKPAPGGGSGLRRLWGAARGSVLARISIANAVSDALSRGVFVIVTVLILQNASEEAYGGWAQLLVLTSLLAPMAALGLMHVVVPFFAPVPWTDAMRRGFLRAIAVALLTSAVAAVAIAIGAPVLNALVVDWDEGTELFRWGSMLIALTGIELLFLLLLQARRRFLRYIACQLAESMCALGAAAVILPQSGDVIRLVQAVVAIKAVMCIVIAAAGVGAIEPGTARPPGIRALVLFGLSVAFAQLGAWTVQLADRLIVGYFQSAGELGVYAAIYTATGLLTVVGGGVKLPAYPSLVRGWADGGRQGMTDALRAPHHVLAYAIPPTAGFLIALFRPALRLIGQSVEVDPGLIAVSTIVVAVAISQWNGLTHFVLVAHEGGKAITRAWMIGAVISVAGSFALIPLFGLSGAGVATLLAMTVVHALLAGRSRRWVDLRDAYAWRTTTRSVAATGIAAVAGLVASGLGSDSFLGLTIASALYWVVFLAVATMLGERPFRTSPEG